MTNPILQQNVVDIEAAIVRYAAGALNIDMNRCTEAQLLDVLKKLESYRLAWNFGGPMESVLSGLLKARDEALRRAEA